MKTIKIIITAILLIKIVATQAQSPIVDDRAHRKYWYYRTRMINDFTKIGKNQGDCIVFAERNQGPNDHTAKVGVDQIDIMNQYLMVLALEYKFLLYGNQSTTETLKEIYHILYTINRLDAEAEQFWYPLQNAPATDHIQPNYNDDLNGFILREDMPQDYITNNNRHFNYSKNVSNSNSTGGFTDVEELIELDKDNPFSNFRGFNPNQVYTYDDCGDHPGCQDGYCKPRCSLSWTQDKYHSLFVALLFLNKYMSSNTGYVDENGALQYFQDNEWDIKTEVRNIADRCHRYVRGNIFGAPLSDWIMEYPDGNDMPVFQDGQAYPYAYAWSRIICRIHDDFPWGTPCSSYTDAWSGSPEAYAVYNDLFEDPIPSGFPLGSNDASVFRTYDQAGCNIDITPVPGGISIPLWYAMQLEDEQNKFAWGSYMRKILYEDGQLGQSLESLAIPLNDAPCNGPWNFDNYDWAGPDWASQDRNEHPDAIGDSSPGFPARYPGVDYMLLHNLYYEHLIQENISGAYTNPVNLMDNFDAMVWPLNLQFLGPNWPNITVGINGNKAAVKMFQNLTSTAHIYATASPSAPANATPSEVEYKAGKEIALMPGFAVEQGANFAAWVHRYLCSEGSYEDGLRQVPGSSNDYLSDEMNTTVPIHYIQGPSAQPGKTATASANGPNKSTENKRVDTRCVVMPNPNDGRFTIATSPANDDEVFAISIYDMSGNKVLDYPAYKGRETIQVDLSQYSKGIYMINATSNLGYKKSIKISVQ